MIQLAGHPPTSSDKRSFDAGSGLWVTKIFSGDWYVTQENEMLVTILGSCISACVRDPVAGVGGMNHFLLPGDDATIPKANDSARYGVAAMENLFNALFKAGARKERLEIKVFGGGNVTNGNVRIGSTNAAFIRYFLTREGLRIASEDMEGTQPRRLHYYPLTGKVMMRKLPAKDSTRLLDEENRYRKTLLNRPSEGDVDLF